MDTAQLSFAEVVRGGATGGHVTGSHVSHVIGSDVTGSDLSDVSRAGSKFCVCANEVAQYPLLFTGSDVSHVTGKGPVRKCSCAHAQPFPAIFSYSRSSTSTMDTEGHPKGCAQPEVGYRK